MKKDSRKKGCPNSKCIKNQTQFKYEATDVYCTLCKEKLVYVCKAQKCFNKIDNCGTDHKYCAICEAKRADKRNKHFERAKKIGVGVGSVALAVVSLVGGRIIKK